MVTVVGLTASPIWDHAFELRQKSTRISSLPTSTALSLISTVAAVSFVGRRRRLEGRIRVQAHLDMAFGTLSSPRSITHGIDDRLNPLTNPSGACSLKLPEVARRYDPAAVTVVDTADHHKLIPAPPFSTGRLITR